MICVRRYAALVPVLAVHGIQYERSKFAKKFPVGTPLPHTKVIRIACRFEFSRDAPW